MKTEKIVLNIDNLNLILYIGKKTSKSINLECHSHEDYSLIEQTYCCHENIKHRYFQQIITGLINDAAQKLSSYESTSIQVGSLESIYLNIERIESSLESSLESSSKSYSETFSQDSHKVDLNRLNYCKEILKQDLDIEHNIGSAYFRRKVVNSLLKKFIFTNEFMSSSLSEASKFIFIIGHSSEGVCLTKYHVNSPEQTSFCFNEFFIPSNVVTTGCDAITFNKFYLQFPDVAYDALHEALTIKLTLEDFIEVFNQYPVSTVMVLGNTDDVQTFKKNLSSKYPTLDQTLDSPSLKEIAERSLEYVFEKTPYLEDYRDTVILKQAKERSNVQKNYRSVVNNKYRSEFNSSKNSSRSACHNSHFSRKIMRKR